MTTASDDVVPILTSCDEGDGLHHEVEIDGVGPKPEVVETRVYAKRWYILAVFSVLGILQVILYYYHLTMTREATGIASPRSINFHHKWR